jgi:hypothetical protein
VEYKPETQLQKAAYLLLRNSALVKFCANPDCQTPYFVARKTIQRYCSLDCLRPFQKAWKRSWWEREGKGRRSRRAKKQGKAKVANKARRR